VGGLLKCVVMKMTVHACLATPSRCGNIILTLFGQESYTRASPNEAWVFFILILASYWQRIMMGPSKFILFKRGGSMSPIDKIPRRVVTGIQEGKSAIISDEKITNVSEHIPQLIISDVWSTDTMPVDLNKDLQIENSLFPKTPQNGSYFRYVHIPPDAELKAYLPPMDNLPPDAPHPLMHKTDTLDYIIILSGEIYLIMETGETLLKAGDIVIQRGTNHAWSNRSNSACIQVAILLDAGKGL
jgi:hypothetical protein